MLIRSSRRLVLATAVFVFVFSLAPALATASSSYSLSYLDTEHIGSMFAINSAGIATGNIRDSGQFQAAVWTYGQPMPLPQEGEWRYSAGEEINDTGTIVGSASLEDSFDKFKNFPLDRFPVKWANDGTYSELETLNGSGEAFAINNNGLIGGWASDADGRVFAALWEDGKLILLDALDGAGLGTVWGINDDGVAAGWSMMDGTLHATTWLDEIPQALDQGIYRSSIAFGISPQGWALGVVYGYEGVYYPAVWIDTELYVLETGIGVGGGEAVGASSDGFVIGNGEADDTVQPMLWSYDAENDAFTSTNLEWPDRSPRSFPQDINEHNVIAGNGVLDDVVHANIWTPILRETSEWG